MKRQPIDAADILPEHFRGYTATAPLKPDPDQDEKTPDTTHFRGYTATAPLKLECIALKWMKVQLFPWLHSHGPIEALWPELRSRAIQPISVATQPRPH